MPEPFVALPALLAALDATCEARSCTVDDVAAEVDAMADWARPVTGDVLDAMVRGTFVPSDELAMAVAKVLSVDNDDLFEPHADVRHLLKGQRLTDDDIGLRGASRAAGRLE